MLLGIDYKKILDELYDGVYVVDRNRVIHYWNRGAERLSGYDAKEVVGSSCQDNILVHVSELGQNLCLSDCPLQLAMARDSHQEEAVYLSHKAGHRVPVMVSVTPLKDETGEIIGAVEIFSDNSHSCKTQERLQELEQLALIDSLTDLPNRRYLEAQLESRLAEFERYKWPFGVLFMDIDHFKKVNDTYGHDFGDQTLKMIAKTLDSATRSHDLIGRWGGEEFLAIVLNVSPESLFQIGERYRHLVMNSSLDYEGREVSFTISGGGVVAEPGDSVERLIERADRYMYEAKNAGRNKMVVI